MMGTNVAQVQPGTDVIKLCESIAGDLGVLYKECSVSDPSGQTCAAVSQMLQAIGHIQKQIMDGGGEMAGPPGDGYPLAPQHRTPIDMAAASMAPGPPQ